MSDKTHAQLKEEATALGLTFKGNTSKDELSAMIEEFYAKEAEGDTVKAISFDEIDEALEEVENMLPKRVATKVSNIKNKQNKEALLRKKIAEAKKQAFAKRVVTITSNDTRDNQHVTAVPLFFENQYFALDRIVPLNIPVELEQCLIDIAKTTTIAIHKRESADGGRTVGKTIYAKKFNISYEE
jgi:hypothetical protein